MYVSDYIGDKIITFNKLKNLPSFPYRRYLPIYKHGSDDGFVKAFMLIDCDNDDRLGFVRKVYGILATQLCFTFGFVAMAATIDGLVESILANPIL